MAAVTGQDVPSGFNPNQLIPPAKFGVWGDSGDGDGVIGSSSLAGIQQVDTTVPGGIGVLGINDQVLGIGVDGRAAQGVGVSGQSTNGLGVFGSSTSALGVRGESRTGTGVEGSSPYGVGVSGLGGEVGVSGRASNYGVGAFNSRNTNAAYLASDCCAGWFTGQVHITGPLTKGGGGFLIDHPLHPAERFLSHSFVESAEMKNMYDGVVVLNDNGQATVGLPDWFEALNTDLRYQFTAVGSPAPNLHIARELADRSFEIAGGRPMMRVCWQVTGVRRDAWAKAYPLNVDEEKSADERGRYLNPEVHDQPIDRGIAFVRHRPRHGEQE